MNKNMIRRISNFSLLLALLFPPALTAQSGPGTGGYDNEGRAVTAILPFTGEEEPAAVFNRAVVDAVAALSKYSPRIVSARTVEAAGVRVPTDMPPVRELVPGARFALTGGVYPGAYAGEFYLQLWLWDMARSSMIYTDDLVYEHMDEGLGALPGLVEWLFSHITETVGEEEKPPETDRDKFITAGLRSGFSQRWYTESPEFAPGAHALNFEGGLFVSFLLNSLLSFQAEIDFTVDTLVYRGIDNTGGGGGYAPSLGNKRYTTYSLTFPLILKANFKARGFHLASFGGFYAFLPLGNTGYQRNPGGEQRALSWSAAAPLGFTLGFEGARKLGPGLLIADIRYAGDFSAITLHDTEDISYGRKGLSVTVGYAFGFIDARPRR
ncbi:MAG: hypothetical protein LBF77_04620 [Spirochaetaceae bacterium]|jgi:hypothetical protein|nr:hypothetical protein [Spirochaetaceae bacterium]